MVLGTKLTWTKWRALFTLVLGCILVASPNFNNDSSKNKDTQYQLLGYGAVLLEVALSGFASIYFEKVVKSTTEVITIWERNYQLGLYSIIMYGSIIIYEGYQGVNGFSWKNWSFLTFFVSALGAGGMCLKSKY
jgi:solute carrier family 35 (UDP-sugar transporter), member A1/2/3